MDLYGAKSRSQSKLRSMDHDLVYRTTADCALAHALKSFVFLAKYIEPDTVCRIGNIVIGENINPCKEIYYNRKQEGGWQHSKAFDGKSFLDAWTPSYGVYRVFDEEVAMSHELWKEMVNPDLGKPFYAASTPWAKSPFELNSFMELMSGDKVINSLPARLL